MGFDTVRTVTGVRARVAAWRREGVRIGLAPTMGALHDGHLSLLDALRAADAERLVATIFVNPTQFGPSEDFDAYPRDEARDAALLAEAGCHLLYAPSVAEMYPRGFATRVIVDRLSEPLCGASRPGHFDGVALIVTKLLTQALADVAAFGEKDWQQLAIIKRMARDLDLPTEVIGAPILREADGLAMSSRNRYLSAEERAAAPALHRALRAAASDLRAGEAAAQALNAARDAVLAAGFRAVDYLEARDGATLAAYQDGEPLKGVRLFAAAHLGRARLIDNIPASA